jgi:hypothetical protein
MCVLYLVTNRWELRLVKLVEVVVKILVREVAARENAGQLSSLRVYHIDQLSILFKLPNILQQAMQSLARRRP